MFIIAFEGIDASGKNTQSKLLYECLSSAGFKVLLESFPRYNGPIGELIEKVLNKEDRVPDELLHAMMEIDRYHFVLEMVEKINSGLRYDFMIFDRWTLSNIAYAYAKGYKPEWVRKLQCGLPKPDITFILDVSVEESEKRRPTRRDSHEKNSKLLSRVREFYVKANKAFPCDRICLINGERPSEEIHHEILTHLSNLITGLTISSGANGTVK